MNFYNLTPQGHFIYRKFQEKEHLLSNKNFISYEPPKEDGEGWSTWQLWRIMEIFGGKNARLGMPEAFKTEIEFDQT